MRTSAAAGGLAAIVFGLAVLASTALQLAQQTLGFQDTDSPAVNLSYLRDHPENYLHQGLAMFVMALALAIVVFAVWDVLAGRSGSLGLRTVSALGLMAAASFFLFGVMRYGVRPLLYIDSLDTSWGESAYLVQQIAGVHGFAAAAIVTMCGWAVGVAILGDRSRALPRWLALFAIIPAFRLLTFIGPLLPQDVDLGGLWIVLMLSIPGTTVWFVLLGVVLLRRGLRPAPSPAPAPA
ncbi:MAG TPA: hypothetical protein VM451_00195 [Candidatus Limnocylindria bacterium]|nr:hypothetical protein [Candidatus Limnocylindria bacterium]